MKKLIDLGKHVYKHHASIEEQVDGNRADSNDDKFRINKISFNMPKYRNEMDNIIKAINKKSYVDELFKVTT